MNFKTMKIACIIPARLHSTRFPRKILMPLGGKPLIERTWEAANSISGFSDVILAIDDPETEALVKTFGGRYLMTSRDHPSGTSRMIEVMNSGIIDADIWVNWQCDEPYISQELINDLLQSAHTSASDVWTLKKEITDFSDITNPNVVKVVCDASGNALYFSRNSIPFQRDNGTTPRYFRHIGMYAFTKKALQKISHLPACELEEVEKLEQLRFLYHGMRIQVHQTHHVSHDINVPEDMLRAEHLFEKRKEQA